MDERTTRLESSQPRHPGAYRRLWAAPYPTATHVRERERGREERDEVHEEDRVIPTDEGKRRERRFTQPSRRAKIHVERHAVVDAPISHVVSSLHAPHFFSIFFQETVKLTSLLLPRKFSLSLAPAILTLLTHTVSHRRVRARTYVHTRTHTQTRARTKSFAHSIQTLRFEYTPHSNYVDDGEHTTRTNSETKITRGE